MKLYVLEEYEDWSCHHCQENYAWIIVGVVDNEVTAQEWEGEDFANRRYGEFSLNEL